MKKKKLNNGVICISESFVYSCPIVVDADFKGVTLALFSNDYIMHFRNLFKSRSLKRKISDIEDEIQAGLIASDYGYVIMQYKKNKGSIYLPEFYNLYQLRSIIDELEHKEKFKFDLYKQSNDNRESFLNLNECDADFIVRSTYYDLCYDAQNGLAGTSSKVKAITKN